MSKDRGQQGAGDPRPWPSPANPILQRGTGAAGGLWWGCCPEALAGELRGTFLGAGCQMSVEFQVGIVALAWPATASDLLAWLQGGLPTCPRRLSGEKRIPHVHGVLWLAGPPFGVTAGLVSYCRVFLGRPGHSPARGLTRGCAHVPRRQRSCEPSWSPGRQLPSLPRLGGGGRGWGCD